MKKRRAVVLLSGGIDSATAMAVAKRDGFELFAITFNYGQRHIIEIDCSRKIVKHFGVCSHLIIELPSEIFSISSLSARSDISVPKMRNISIKDDIPTTYVPGRNILFLAYALSFAETIASRDIFIGANSVDYSGYPDCRPEFLDAFEKMANMGTRSGLMGEKINIRAPLIQMKKYEIINLGLKLDLDYSMTHSCYAPSADGLSCGKCDSCLIRKKGFADAGIPDPARYELL